MKWCINRRCDNGEYKPYYIYISDNGVKLEAFMCQVDLKPDVKIKLFRTKQSATNYNGRYNRRDKDTEIIEAEPVLLWYAEQKLRQL